MGSLFNAESSKQHRLISPVHNDEGPARPSSDIQPAEAVARDVDANLLPPTRPTTATRRPSSLFIEALPEYKPYHLLTPVRHRKNRSLGSPTLSLSLKRRKRRASEESRASKGRRAQRQRDTDLHSPARRKARKTDKGWKKRCWVCWNSKASAEGQQAGQPVQTSPATAFDSLGGVEAPSTTVVIDAPIRLPSKPEAIPEKPLRRRPSTLKKRPPRGSPPSIRSSTYSEWRSSMIISVSIDVSRRSSMKSKSGRPRSRASVAKKRVSAVNERQSLESKKASILVLGRVILASLKRWYRCGNGEQHQSE